MKSPVNNKPDEQGKQPDSDIEQLFRQQSVNIPAELDDAILATARNALVDKADSSRPVRSRLPQWFAVAAMLVIGISLTPLLLRAPESILPESTLSESTLSEQASPDSSSVVENSPQAFDVAPKRESAAAGTISEDLVKNMPPPSVNTRQSADIQAKPNSLSERQGSEDRSGNQLMGGSSGDNLSLTLDDTLSAESTSSPVDTGQAPEFRANRRSWFVHMQKLYTEGNTTDLEKEIALYNKAYPDQQPLLSMEVLKRTPSQLNTTRPDIPDK